jgi:3-methyladenine DNA glycosylase AlkD
MIEDLQKETKSLINKEKAKLLQGFFKTGKGEYGEGDIFYGLTVPESRKIVLKYKDLPLSETVLLLKSKIHEERLIALLILVSKYQKGDQKTKEKIYNLYLKSTKYINNWDLVDSSAHKIIGDYLIVSVSKNKSILEHLAKSKILWERRISIISTFAFINRGSAKETLKISEILVNDKHDLIQKAVGWALREVGKRVSLKDERKFLDKYASTMPRTMLRYAIERFDSKLKNEYLQAKQRTTSGN